MASLSVASEVSHGKTDDNQPGSHRTDDLHDTPDQCTTMAADGVCLGDLEK